jgi:predicted double-glycine peptidase
MNPWNQTILVMAVAGSGIALGRLYFGRSYKRAVSGSFAAIGWILFLLTAHFLHLYTLYSGLDWIAASRSKYILICFAVCLGLVSPLRYLSSPWKRTLTVGVLACFLLLFAGLPFAGPAVYQKQIQNLPTHLDTRGLCRQSLSYTCGPAAAVTALRQLGLEASESQIAAAAGTAPWLGTSSWDLYRAIDRLYPEDQLHCRYERFQSLDQLPGGSFSLAVMREGFLMDHCVTILKITPSEVLLADPSAGLRIMPRAEFQAAWRHTAIVLSRPQVSVAQP